MTNMNQLQNTVNAERTVPANRSCYTVDDLMEILGVGRKAIYALIHKRAFPTLRIGSIGYRIPKDSFLAWIYQQQV